MNISVTYRDSIDQSDNLEARLERRLERIDQKLQSPAHYKVVFEREAHEFRAHVSFMVERQEVVADACTDDIYKSVDQVTDRVERQVRRIHDKRANH